MRYLSVPAVVLACAAARAQFGFVQRIDVPPPAKVLEEWIAPGLETAHFLIRSESIMVGSRADLGEHLEGVHGGYLNSLGLSAYVGSAPLASTEAADKAVADAEKGKLIRRTRHGTVRSLPDRTLVSVREGGKKVVTFPDGSRAMNAGEEWKVESPAERLRGRCEVWLFPTEGQYRAFMSSYYPHRTVTRNAFYDHDADRIVAWRSPDHRNAITGELVRRLLSCAFGATPPWLEEGLSRLTRNSASGEVRPLPIETTRKLRYMVLRGAYVPVAGLIELTAAEFDDSVNRPVYALQSWGLTEFMMRADGGKHFHAFLQALREGVTSRNALKSAFAGARKVQNKWLQYLVNETKRVRPVEGFALLRTDRRDAGPAGGGRSSMFAVRVKQKTGEAVSNVELWIYMVVRTRSATSPKGHLFLGRWTWGQLDEGVHNISQTLSPEEMEKWGDHPDAVRAELYWNGQLIDIDTNGQYSPLKSWWLLMEPVKWMHR